MLLVIKSSISKNPCYHLICFRHPQLLRQAESTHNSSPSLIHFLLNITHTFSLSPQSLHLLQERPPCVLSPTEFGPSCSSPLHASALPPWDQKRKKKREKNRKKGPVLFATIAPLELIWLRNLPPLITFWPRRSLLRYL